jgi:hypothetical protein
MKNKIVNHNNNMNKFILRNYTNPELLDVKGGCTSASFLKHNDKLFLICRKTNYSFLNGNSTLLFSFDDSIYSEEIIFIYDDKAGRYYFYKNISDVSSFDKKSYLISGKEDFRLISWNNRLYVTYTDAIKKKNFPLVGTMHFCELDDEFNLKNDVTIPTENLIEKNWQPIENHDYEYVYSYNPLKILNVNDGFFNEKYCNLEGIKGSSQIIKYKDFYIGIVHENKVSKCKKDVLHYFVFFDKDLNFIKKSDPFKFFGCDIEFCTYIGIIDDKLNILASVNDQLSYRFVLNGNIINEIFNCGLTKDFIDDDLYTVLFIDSLRTENNIAAICFGTFIKDSALKKIALSKLKELYYGNENYDKIRSLLLRNKEEYIVSMTTIPSRMGTLKENIKSILEQSFHFDRFVINIDDNLKNSDYDFYFSLKDMDDRIEVYKCDSKWRSCNKLLPTIKMYPESVVITVDDDLYYPKDSLKMVVDEYANNKSCIITLASNPVLFENGVYQGYALYDDLPLKQKGYSKYLSNCCLFPPHIFDNTDVFNYDDMIECTNGTHDELWFWIHSTIKGVKVITVANYLKYIEEYFLEDAYSDGYKLCDINKGDMLDYYTDKINRKYGEQLNKVLSEKTEIVVDSDNIYNLFYNFYFIKYFYNNFVLNVDKLPKGKIRELRLFLEGSEINLDDVVKK